MDLRNILETKEKPDNVQWMYKYGLYVHKLWDERIIINNTITFYVYYIQNVMFLAEKYQT